MIVYRASFLIADTEEGGDLDVFFRTLTKARAHLKETLTPVDCSEHDEGSITKLEIAVRGPLAILNLLNRTKYVDEVTLIETWTIKGGKVVKVKP